MKRLLRFASVWFAIAVAAEAKAPGEDRLIGEWVIDVKATEAYLRANNILPDAVLDRMRPMLAKMRLIYDSTGVQKLGEDGLPEGRTEIHIVVRSEKRTIFTSLDAKGTKVTTTLIWEADAYWQETTVFPGYRERFIRPKITKKPN